MADVICPACGKAVPPIGGEELRYCPFCAAELGAPAEERPAAGNAELLAALKAAAVEGIAELRKKLRPRGLLDWVIGGDTRWNNELTARFIADVRAASGSLAQNLAREPDGDVALAAAEFLLLGIYETADQKDRESMDLVYVATERNAQDFIPLLREADRADLGLRYRQKNKKTPLLPVQREILKALLPKKGNR